MTALARARGILVSVAAHVVAGALLLTLSAPEWTRPLFVDLVERAESIGGSPGMPSALSARPGAGPEADVPSAPRGHSMRTRRASAWPSRSRPKNAASSATSNSDAAARVQPAPTSPSAPDPGPTPPSGSPPAVPLPAASTPPAASSAPQATASSPPPARGPSAPEPSASSKPSVSGSPLDAGSGPSAEAGRSPLAGGAARGEGEVRGDAGASVGGAPGAALALGTGGGAVPPEYGPYLQRFRRHVQESLVYPLAARRQSLRGTVELDVALDPSGRVRDVRVARSSGTGILDDAAVDILRRLDPLPLPESLPRRPLLIRLPLVFDLR